MKEAFHIERGIDTFCLCSILSNSQKKGILRYLRKREKFFTTSDSDYWTDKSKYRCNCFEEDGIKLELSNWNRDGNGGWNLFVRIKPALILGLEPWALYRPNKSSYRQLMNRADLLLSTVGIHESIKTMSICRIDVTENQCYDVQEDVMQHLRLLKKSMIPAKYKQTRFPKNDGTARDPKAANQHSYKIACKSTAFFAYDKTAQLQMIDRFPPSLMGQHILRLEVQMKRKAILKKIGKQSSQYQELKACAQSTEHILHWFLKRLQPKCDRYVGYADANALVSGIHKKTKRDYMLYLLRKTSDSDNLTYAMKKLKEHFQLSDSQCRNILKAFSKLGISPITLPNAVEK